MKTEVTANWTAAVLVCRKCQKKVGKRFGRDGDQTLAKALRRELAGGKGRKALLGVVETGCLGVCPKGAVTILNGGAPGQWHLVRPGVTGAEVAELLGMERVHDQGPEELTSL